MRKHCCFLCYCCVWPSVELWLVHLTLLSKGHNLVVGRTDIKQVTLHCFFKAGSVYVILASILVRFAFSSLLLSSVYLQGNRFASSSLPTRQNVSNILFQVLSLHLSGMRDFINNKITISIALVLIGIIFTTPPIEYWFIYKQIWLLAPYAQYVESVLFMMFLYSMWMILLVSNNMWHVK